ncbi:MAG: 2-oxo acid dehydrogenase subunit E2 [Nanoarchaeota archaeon]|nr:2-oxo acid dehydrogenase subunit E2 [Nanoarchaeota archaeon]
MAYETGRAIASVTVQVRAEPVKKRMEALKKTVIVSAGDLLVHAIGKALRKFPQFNAREGKPCNQVHIGYIISVGKGPREMVLEQVDALSVEETAKGIKGLALKYLHGEKAEGESTVLVTNLAAFHAYGAIAPIKKGHVATFALASEYDGVEIREGIAHPDKKFNVTLSFDAEAADCQAALQCLNEIKKTLESE